MAQESLSYVRIGARLNGARLVEQGNVTLELTGKNAGALNPFGITTTRLNEYRNLVGTVQKAAGDKALAKEEATLATDQQNKTLLEAKDWQRVLLAIADNAFIDQPAITRAFHAGPKIGSSVPRLIAALNDRLELARAHLKSLEEWGGTAAFLKQGEQLLGKLEGIDGQQEATIKNLPKVTQDYYRAKGELFIGLKRINRAAKAAFINDRVLRAQFNLDVLYRNATTRKPATVVPAK